MGTATAQIMIGQSHSYDGGIINMSHMAMLSENGVARWTIRSSGWFDDSDVEPMAVSWIPMPDTMLEDGILMIGLLVWKVPELVALAERLFKVPLSEVRVINEEVISKDDLLRLHAKSRSLTLNRKLALTIMYGSTLNSQYDVLGHYHIETEVCRSEQYK